MSISGGRTEYENGFVIVWGELKRRTKKPRWQVVYWTYFIGSVCILGSIGLLTEFCRYFFTGSSKDAAGIYTSMATFFPALIGSSVMQMMFEQAPNRLPNRRLQAVSFFSLLATFGAALYLNAFSDHLSYPSWFAVSFFCISSLWIWWISNADNAGLYDNPSLDAPTGGENPNIKLQGDISGFQL